MFYSRLTLKNIELSGLHFQSISHPHDSLTSRNPCKALQRKTAIEKKKVQPGLIYKKAENTPALTILRSKLKS